jgi:heme exporter protein D
VPNGERGGRDPGRKVEAMSEFFAMGGYAWYVWMAYGAVALVLAVEIAAVRARRRRAFELARMSVEPLGSMSTAAPRSGG